MKDPVRLKILPGDRDFHFEFELSAGDVELRLATRLLGAERQRLEAQLESLRGEANVCCWQGARCSRGSLESLSEALLAVFPESLLDWLRSLGGRPVQLVSEEGQLPWELTRVLEGPWYESAPVARSLAEPVRVLGTPEGEATLRALVVVDPDGLGSWAEAEAGRVAEALGPSLEVEVWRREQATVEAFRRALSGGRYGLVHLIAFRDEQNRIYLNDGPVGADDFEKLAGTVRPRFVFLHLADIQAGPDGLCERAGTAGLALLRAGVSAVLAPMWSGDPVEVADFAAELYRGWKDRDLGAALGSSRRTPGSTCAASAFLAFGDLGLRWDQIHPVEVETAASAATLRGSLEADFRLVVSAGPQKGHDIPLYAAVLRSGRAVTLGGPGPRHSDITLEDPELEDLALRLELEQEGLALVNLTGHPDRVRVNGLPVRQRVRLEGWEVIEIGSSSLRLEAGSVRPRQEAETPEQGRYRIEVLDGGEQDRGRMLALGSSLALVGRFRDCGLMLHDPAVSRHHLALVPRGRFYYLNRIGASRVVVNGTLLEDEHELRHDDRLQLSDRTMLRFVDGRRGT
ncbi:MAG: FHA domain-containing protein [Armatimonadetes bacterium]|nr:FHA domain-containing protein [Armatimonadota bacterium]